MDFAERKIISRRTFLAGSFRLIVPFLIKLNILWHIYFYLQSSLPRQNKLIVNVGTPIIGLFWLVYLSKRIIPPKPPNKKSTRRLQTTHQSNQLKSFHPDWMILSEIMLSLWFIGTYISSALNTLTNC